MLELGSRLRLGSRSGLQSFTMRDNAKQGYTVYTYCFILGCQLSFYLVFLLLCPDDKIPRCLRGKIININPPGSVADPDPVGSCLFGSPEGYGS